MVHTVWCIQILLYRSLATQTQSAIAWARISVSHLHPALLHELVFVSLSGQLVLVLGLVLGNARFFLKVLALLLAVHPLLFNFELVGTQKCLLHRDECSICHLDEENSLDLRSRLCSSRLPAPCEPHTP